MACVVFFPALYDLAVLKKRVKEKEDRKKKKIKLIKSEAEDLAEPLSSTEGVPPLSEAPSPLAISAIKEEYVSHRNYMLFRVGG